MHTINKSICTFDKETNTLVTEASTAGLKPGEWPDFISIVNDEGEGYLFHRVRPDVDEGIQLVGMNTHGIKLLVIND